MNTPDTGDDRRRLDRRDTFVRLADYTIPEVRKAIITSGLLLAVMALFLYMIHEVIVAVITGVVFAVYLLPLHRRVEVRLRNATATAIATILVVAVARVEQLDRDPPVQPVVVRAERARQLAAQSPGCTATTSLDQALQSPHVDAVTTAARDVVGLDPVDAVLEAKRRDRERLSSRSHLKHVQENLLRVEELATVLKLTQVGETRSLRRSGEHWLRNSAK